MITTLNNCNVAITGGLKKMVRAKAYSLIRADGGTVKDKITKDTDILIIADDEIKCFHHSAKYEKAERWGIETITEADFYEIVGA